MPQLLTTAEAAHKLGISPSAISYAVARGRLKYTRKLPGKRGQFFFSHARLAAYESSRCKG